MAVYITGTVSTKNNQKYQWSDGALTLEPYRTDVSTSDAPGPSYTATPIPGATYSTMRGGWVGPDGVPLTQAQLTRPDGSIWSTDQTGGGTGSGGYTVTGGQWVMPGSGGGGLFGQGGGFLGLGDLQAALGYGGLAYLVGSALGGAGTAAADTATGTIAGDAYLPGALGSGTAALPTVGFTGSGLTAASAGAGMGLQSGGATGLLAPGVSTVGSALSTDLAANSLAPTLGLTGALGAAATGLGAGTTAGTLAGLSNSGLLSAGLNTAAGLIQGQSASDAAKTYADAQIRAAQIAADAAKFKPVGVTTGFGSSKFGFDANGNLTSAGYTLTPEMQAQRDALIAQSGGLLSQAGGAQAATAGMGTAAQRAMALGNQYLGADPQAIAQKYMADQQALLASGNASALTDIRDRLNATGRTGFSIGGGVGGETASNPELQAYYNALIKQNLGLAANATQAGMDYTKFGAGLVGTGGDLLSGMYKTQTSAYDPYNTALKGAQTVEGLGQNALTLGMDLGKTATTASTNAGGLLASGMNNAAGTMAQANAYSPWAGLLAGAGQAAQNYSWT